MKRFFSGENGMRRVLSSGVILMLMVGLQTNLFSGGITVCLAGDAWKTVVDDKMADPPLLIEDPDADDEGVVPGGTGGGEPVPGGSCEYIDISGTAEILSVSRLEKPSPSECIDAVLVYYRFIPDNPRAMNHSLHPWRKNHKVRFFLGVGNNPPMKWVVKKNLLPTSRHRCLRSERKSGACSPVVFSLPDIDETDWGKDCFGRR